MPTKASPKVEHPTDRRPRTLAQADKAMRGIVRELKVVRNLFYSVPDEVNAAAFAKAKEVDWALEHLFNWDDTWDEDE